MKLLADQRVDVKSLITHRFPIEDAPAAYELITGKSTPTFLGVLLTYPEASTDSIAQKDDNQPVIKTVLPLTGVNKVRLGVIGAGNFANAVMLPA